MKNISFFIAKIALLSFFMTAALPILSIYQTSANAQQASATGTGTSSAIATDDQLNKNALVNTMCNVLRLVTGTAGKAFAAFAIISVGIGFFTGKVSWGLLIGVAMGIAAMFGAPTIVAAISGSSEASCDTGA